MGEIQILTEASEWRFEPGKLNPADGATRSEIKCEALPHDWLEGPQFLQEPNDQWPSDLPWLVVSEDMKTVRAHHGKTTSSDFSWAEIGLTAENLYQFLQFDGQS